MGYPRQIAHGIMFHHFHGGSYPRGQGSISQEEFEVLLRFLGVERILRPSEWLERLDQQTLSPDHLCLTFDDALRCQFDLALPVLERYRLQAFWFVYSNVFEGQLGAVEIYRAFRTVHFPSIEAFYDRFFSKVEASEHADRARAVLEDGEIERYRAQFPFYSVNDVRFRFVRDRVLGRQAYERMMDGLMRETGVGAEDVADGLWMSNEHLRHLSERGHVIGLHSYSHPTALAQLPYEDQVEEYSKNAAHITAICGRAPVAMAHPANSYTAQTIDILNALGIRCGFRSNMTPGRDGARLNPSSLELAREDHANIMRRLACCQG